VNHRAGAHIRKCATLLVNREATMRIVLVLLVSAALATDAEARRRVVVEPFAGAGGAAAAKLVAGVIAEEDTVVSARELARAKKRLKKRAKDPLTVAAAVQADVLVTGAVKGKTLTIVLRDAGGDEIATLTAKVTRGKLTKRARLALAEDVRAALAPPPPPPAPEPAPVAALEPEPTPEPRVVARRAPAGRAADVSLGLSFVARRMSFTVDPTLPAGDRPLDYEGSPVGGAFLAADVWPGAWLGKTGPLANLGASVVYDRALSMHTTLVEGGMSAEYPTAQERLGVGARYRIPWGPRELRLGAGWNRLATTIDSGATAIDFPDTSYSYLDAGAALRVPLGGRFAALADARYLRLLGAGEIFGDEMYGGGTAQGVDVDAALEVELGSRFRVRAGVRYLRVGFAFDGSGAGAERDGDADVDVAGALDEYIGGYVTAGRSF
jgi:hypothetical protein